MGRNEVRQIFGDTPLDEIPAEAMQRMGICTAVLKETLRLYPPASGITPRTAPRDAILGGYSLPAGTSVWVSIYALHHDPETWERPSEFDPSRFLSPAAPPHPYAWMPFSSGHRVCIGMNFAWMEMRIVLAELLRNFEWAPKLGHKLSFSPYITLRPNGMPLMVKTLT